MPMEATKASKTSLFPPSYFQMSVEESMFLDIETGGTTQPRNYKNKLVEYLVSSPRMMWVFLAGKVWSSSEVNVGC